MQEIAALPGAARKVIDTAGHFLFPHPDSFYQQEAKKKAIQARFSRAAASYDSYAVIQKGVARKLALQIKPKRGIRQVRTILEIGCGTGNFTELLATRFPAARITAIDFSPEMVERARAKLENPNIVFLCVEGEKFLQDAPRESYDLVASNGSLQWFANLDKALRSLKCHLRAVHGCDGLVAGRVDGVGGGVQRPLRPGPFCRARGWRKHFRPIFPALF